MTRFSSNLQFDNFDENIIDTWTLVFNLID